MAANPQTRGKASALRTRQFDPNPTAQEGMRLLGPTTAFLYGNFTTADRNDLAECAASGADIQRHSEHGKFKTRERQNHPITQQEKSQGYR
jgi:hypothetical protein